MQGLAIPLLLILSILCLVLLAGGDPYILRIINVTDADQERYLRTRQTPSIGRADRRMSHELTGPVLFAFFGFLAGLVLDICSLFVVVKCYRYLRDRRRHEKSLNRDVRCAEFPLTRSDASFGSRHECTGREQLYQMGVLPANSYSFGRPN